MGTDNVVEVVAEEPVATEEPAGEEVTEEPATEELVAAEEPVAEEPAAEVPITEEVAAVEEVAKEPVVEEPAAEEPVTEEVAAEEPVAELAEEAEERTPTEEVESHVLIEERHLEVETQEEEDDKINVDIPDMSMEEAENDCTKEQETKETEEEKPASRIGNISKLLKDAGHTAQEKARSSYEYADKATNGKLSRAAAALLVEVNASIEKLKKNENVNNVIEASSQKIESFLEYSQGKARTVQDYALVDLLKEKLAMLQNMKEQTISSAPRNLHDVWELLKSLTEALKSTGVYYTGTAYNYACSWIPSPFRKTSAAPVEETPEIELAE